MLADVQSKTCLNLLAIQDSANALKSAHSGISGIAAKTKRYIKNKNLNSIFSTYNNNVSFSFFLRVVPSQLIYTSNAYWRN
jgi:hypothetical protein